jgi:HPt (histidine-containing phosphotransfer) domain-containing protein
MNNQEAAVFNLAETLERVEGDVELLKEMIDLFLAEYPRMLAEIERAITEGDAQALQLAAHQLKGSVSNFAAYGATAASLALEKMGRQQDLSHAATALCALTHELARLSPVLITFKDKEAA